MPVSSPNNHHWIKKTLQVLLSTSTPLNLSYDFWQPLSVKLNQKERESKHLRTSPVALSTPSSTHFKIMTIEIDNKGKNYLVKIYAYFLHCCLSVAQTPPTRPTEFMPTWSNKVLWIRLYLAWPWCIIKYAHLHGDTWKGENMHKGEVEVKKVSYRRLLFTCSQTQVNLHLVSISTGQCIF